MDRMLALLTVTTLCVTASGCGTLLTRGEGNFFGAYPFEAVAA